MQPRRIASQVTPAIDSRVERQILIGMIVSSSFCQAVYPLWRDDAFIFPYAKMIGKWCRDYFSKYSQAPGRHIEDLYANEKKYLDSPDAEAIALFLSDISAEHERKETFNVDYAIEAAEQHFRQTALKNFQAALSQALIAGTPEDGEALISSYVRPSRPVSSGVNPITNLPAVIDAFKSQEIDTLITLPGVLGQAKDMVGPMGRGELMAYVGPSGVGKTWWMIWTGLMACLSGFNVAFFSYEMPWKQIVRRIQHSLTGFPKKELAGEILIPVWDCAANQHGSCKKAQRASRVNLISGKGKPPWEYAPATYIPCVACRGERDWYPESWFRAEERKPINEGDIAAKHKAIVSNYGNRMGDFHVMSAPSGSMSVNDVRTYLKNREYYEGVVTDLIITDSADKMKPESRYGDKDPRHGIYGIWMGHKAMAEEFHAGVLTVSHSNTERSGKKVRQGDWAEDIRKLRESDLAAAINQTPAQAVAGQYSVNMLKKRDLPLNQNISALVLSCLTIGRPYLDSAIERHLPKEQQECGMDELGKRKGK